MLQNFRKKINSVIEKIDIPSIPDNLTTSLKNAHSPIFGVSVPSSIVYQKEDAYTSSTVRQSHQSPSRAVPRNVNLTAGFQQLEKNQETWHSIRAMNEKNADMATELDERIINCRTTAEQRLTDITDLNTTLAILPSIVDQIKSCTESIEEIASSMTVIEMKLVNLEDLVEVLNLQERQLDKRFEMAMYKEKKMAELDLFREKLAKEHAENVGKHEKGMMRIQQERQLVFQDAFQDDLKYYKATGNIPKVVVSKSPPGQELTLEEVVLDDVNTSDDLNDFLAK